MRAISSSEKGTFGDVQHFARLDGQRRVLVEPVRIDAEAEESAKVFEPFLTRDGRVTPRGSELAQGLHIELLERPIPALFSEFQQPAFEHLAKIRERSEASFKPRACASARYLATASFVAMRSRESSAWTSPAASHVCTLSDAACHDVRFRLSRT
jgi:hypothetical protein